MFSVWDEQCNQYFHAGRNSETKQQSVEDCAEMLINGSPAICPCGTEMCDREEKCDDCGWEAKNYFDKEYDLSEKDPDEFLTNWNAHIVEHDEKIEDA